MVLLDEDGTVAISWVVHVALWGMVLVCSTHHCDIDQSGNDLGSGEGASFVVGGRIAIGRYQPVYFIIRFNVWRAGIVRRQGKRETTLQ